MKPFRAFVTDMRAVQAEGHFRLEWHHDYEATLFARGLEFPATTRLRDDQHPFYAHPDPVHPVEMWLAVRGYLGAGLRGVVYDRKKHAASAVSLCRFAAATVSFWKYEWFRLLDLIFCPLPVTADPRLRAVFDVAAGVEAALGLAVKTSRLAYVNCQSIYGKHVAPLPDVIGNLNPAEVW